MRLVILAILICFTHTNGEIPEHLRAILSKFPYFKINPALQQSFHTPEARFCFCGLNTARLNGVGTKIPMFQLAKQQFSFGKANSTTGFQVFNSNYSNAILKGRFTSDMIWYGYADFSFVSYKLQAKMMKSTLDGWAKLLEAGEIKFEVGECDRYIHYGSPLQNNFFETELAARKKAQRKYNPNFAEEFREIINGLGATRDFAEFNVNDKVLPKYFPGPNMTADEAKEMKYPVDSNVDRSISRAMTGNRINVISCHITGDSPLLEPIQNEQMNTIKLDHSILYVEGIMVSSSSANQFKKMFLIVPGEQKFDTWKSLNTLRKLMIPDVKNPSNPVGRLDLTNAELLTQEAFFWDRDVGKINEANAGKKFDEISDLAETASSIVFPNSFEFHLCEGLINYSTLGKLFNMNYFDKGGNLTGLSGNAMMVWDQFHYRCPMIAWRGPFLESRSEENYKPMFWKIPDNLLKPEVGDEKWRTNPNPGPFYLDDLFLKVEGVQYELDPEWGASGTALYEQTNAVIKEQADKLKEMEPIIQEEINLTEIKKLNDEAKIVIKEQLKEDFPEDYIGDEDTKSGTDKEDEATMMTTGNNDEPNYEQEIEINECIALNKKYKVLYDKVEPKTKTETEELLLIFLKYHGKGDCKEMTALLFENNSIFGKNKLIMKYNVTPIPKNDSVNLQIHFFNHDLNNTKDVILIVPSKEFFGEWDKFYNILDSFMKFVIEETGEEQSPQSLYWDMLEKIKNEKIITVENWNTGPLQGTAVTTAKEMKVKMGNPTNNYVAFVFRIQVGEKSESYEIIYQSWRVGNFIVIKLLGTQLNYQVMIDMYTKDASMGDIWDGINDTIYTTYVNEESKVVSRMRIKQLAFDVFQSTSAERSVGFEYKGSNLGDGFTQDHQLTSFLEREYASEEGMFLIKGNLLSYEMPIKVILFISSKESLPVVNLFFMNQMFKAEYLIPMTSEKAFELYLQKVYYECLDHLFDLKQETRKVSDVSASPDDIAHAKEGGTYTFAILVETIIGLLKDSFVYGCVSQYDPGESSEEDAPNKFIAQERFYFLKSNNLFDYDLSKKCTTAENGNSTLIDLYSTNDHGSLSGYALRVNGFNKSTLNRVDTTYHFVKVQDYNHMEVFKKFISKIFDEVFDKRVDTPDKVEE